MKSIIISGLIILGLSVIVLFGIGAVFVQQRSLKEEKNKVIPCQLPRGLWCDGSENGFKYRNTHCIPCDKAKDSEAGWVCFGERSIINE